VQTELADFQSLSARATAARDSNDPSRAIELYKQALESNPKWAEGWWYLGTLLYDGDRYSEGRDALLHLVAVQPSAAPALQILGLCEFETGDYADSLAHIQRGMAAAPPTAAMEAVLRFHEAMLLTRTAQFDKALTEYVWFVRKGIQNPQLTVALGLAALRSAMLPKDIPDNRRDLFEKAGKAAYLSMAGDLPGARAALSELLKQYPDAPYVHYLYGCFLLAADPEAGMDQLRRELQLTPDSGAADAMLAWILLQRGDIAASLPLAKAAAEHDATASLAQYVFGRALLEQGHVAEAIVHLQSAENIDPSNLDTHVLLATAYSKAGKPAEARRERLASLSLWEGKSANANP
jgi:tetratricopeptide (TPR) repeat protein